MTVSTGRRADPEWRHQRAVAAARSRTTPDYYIERLLASAPPLTETQLAKLAVLLRPAKRGAGE
jgi:hypothetical protein